MKRFQRKRRSGIILLVVLVALTFFSVLIATYLVFSNNSRQSSFAMASRNTRGPDPNALLDEALMMLVRGTDDPQNPFYGEDLLSDYYGRGDAHDCRVKEGDSAATPPTGPILLGDSGGSFIRLPIETTTNVRPIDEPYDDVLTGRLITFLAGPLRNRTYRILRSVYRPPTTGVPPQPAYDDVFIELKEDWFATTTPTVAQVRELFYPNPTSTTASGYRIHINGVPRNSKGIGFDTTEVDATVVMPTIADTVANIPAGTNIGFSDLPAALQPNHLRRTVNKSTIKGDFDEGYDAPDFNNWFLSYRDSAGNVIPSFHRPSVLNYILNQRGAWGTPSVSPELDATAVDYRNVLVSLARGTFRPIPIAEKQLLNGGTVATQSRAIDAGFTGGNAEFALRTPVRLLRDDGNLLPNAANRLDQLVRALINGQYDVDNDGDGIPDSIWVDLGLPLVTSREGKLLRPMVAAMIEDLSGRLNVNAHGNTQLQFQAAAMSSDAAEWAGTREPINNAANSEPAFRGVGYGPAEITIPMTSSSGLITNAAIRTELNAIRAARYAGEMGHTFSVPGQWNADPLDVLRTGPRPRSQYNANGYGYSIDPFGRGGIGIGRSGHLVAADSGTLIRADDTMTATVEATINEAVNDPYEMDPSGELNGDQAFSLADLEAILRSSDFDSDMLPQRLRTRTLALLANYREFSRALTTHSRSSDALPGASASEESAFVTLVKLMDPTSALNANQVKRLVAPEFRLGRKLDVNRPFGNGIDDLGTLRVNDDGDGSTDEPDERNGVIDEPYEVANETETFAASPSSGQTVPSDFRTLVPEYLYDETSVPPPPFPPVVNSRTLLARHLYTLMMALTDDGYSFPSVSSTPPTSFDPDLYRARRIAQWAVNVVDYRDPDAIMTRFVYDPNPFDASGWNPPSTSVVWGVESPELLFSESMAFHDVRLRDTNRDSSGKDKSDTPPDEDSDQVRMPQGSLLLELYCPRPTVNTLSTTSALGDETTHAGVPQEFYSVNAMTGAYQLDLTRTAPPRIVGSPGAPVWRIAISERHDALLPPAAAAKTNANPETLRTTLPDTASFQIDAQDELDPTASDLTYDRFIWFNNFGDPVANPSASMTLVDNVITDNVIADMNANQVFFAPNLVGGFNSDRTLEPGQYLCLAPRATTALGSKEYPTVGTFPGIPSEQRLYVVDGQGLMQKRQDGLPLTPAMVAGTGPISPALPLIIGAPRPIPAITGWGPAANVFADDIVGLNVSEPLPNGGSYYPEPLFSYNGMEDLDGAGGMDYPLTDAYIDFEALLDSARDTPLDVGIGRIPDNGAATGPEPLLGTLPEYCSAFLQRLADPTLPHDPVTNPYRTVDWIPIDLTIFSGEDRENNISGAANYTRRTRQRNGFVKRTSGVPVQGHSLYSYETDFANPSVPLDAAAPDYFSFSVAPNAAHLQSSFSFLNTDTALMIPASDINAGFVGFAPTIGSLPGAIANNVVGHDRGLPRVPFAIHPWLNRPFASHLELMMVPGCSQGRLFEEFSFDPTGATDPDVYPTSATSADADLFNAPFRHLLNFFHDSETAGDAAHFARLFDFVHTLPRFRGEVEYINRDRLFASDPVKNAQLNELRSLLLPPFNLTFDDLREGTINLNTLAEFPVWAGLMQGHLNTDEFSSVSGTATANQLAFAKFLESRRGYTPGTGTAARVTAAGPFNYAPNLLDERFPTQFAGLFTNNINAKHAPELRDPAATGLLRRRGVNGTLLRGLGTVATNDPDETGAANVTPMFVRAQGQLPTQNLDLPVGINPTGDLHLDRKRNPFLRYQTLMRMPNLVSDNSQVFVLRLTLGLFEVDSGTESLGREYNEETGQNQRYKALFIIDRSREVGFVPGVDLNARDTVLFESYAQ
ncbi:hypothetical protein [Novipirellula artificiosorum]|uniref:Uncharacterized protein n=1 Tax=Novipirellula artificiosorum TaxID=2528016 RepID=A0A5C6DDI1_9BACT|nr:hypothetical protein [Novipirellula artificiosorum]TWU33751.1 hypothetical protein Poly41_47480 [Novipirellula artificiosorum]